MVFPVWMWELDYKESWVRKNRCFWIVVLEKTLESPLDCKEIQPVHPKGNQSWIFIGRTDAEGETPILWPPDAKNGLIWKDREAGKDWRQEEKGTTEDEMVGWHHDAMDMCLNRLWELVVGREVWLQSMGLQRVDHDWVTELNELNILLYIYHIFFIHSSVNGYFHVLAILNSAAMNIEAHVSFSIMVFSGYTPSSEISGSYSSFIPSFLKESL